VSIVSDDDGEDLATCEMCPVGRTTRGTPTVGIAACVCLTGSFSYVRSTGDDAGILQCLQCPLNMTTHSLGASSLSDCYCQPGAVTFTLDTGALWLGAVGMCVTCPLNTYNSNTSLRGSKCTPCPRDTRALATGSSDVSDCEYYVPDIRVTARPTCLSYLSSDLSGITTVSAMLNSLATWHNSDHVIVLPQSLSSPVWRHSLNPEVLQAICAPSPAPCTWSPVNRALLLDPTTLYRIRGRGNTTIFESAEHRLATTLDPPALCAA